jgi:hypothetical protein
VASWCRCDTDGCVLTIPVLARTGWSPGCVGVHAIGLLWKELPPVSENRSLPAASVQQHGGSWSAQVPFVGNFEQLVHTFTLTFSTCCAHNSTPDTKTAAQTSDRNLHSLPTQHGLTAKAARWSTAICRHTARRMCQTQVRSVVKPA